MESAKPTLLELQRWMKWAVTDTGHPAPKPDCTVHVADAKPLARHERIRIYADGYLARIVESLQSDFEALDAALEHDELVRLTEEYLRAHPSRYANIGEVGRHLADFLLNSPAAFVRELVGGRDYLPDLARLEWTLQTAFFADDLPPLDPATLASVAAEDWPRARFTLDASMRIVDVAWPVHALWLARDSLDAEFFADFEPAELILLVHRSESAGGHGVSARAITPLQRWTLERMRAGDTLGALLENLAEREPDVEPPLMEWFGDWIREGLIRKVTFV